MIEISCPIEADTRGVAARLAALCRPGDVIALAGPLGAGKTVFASGLADGLGVEEQVVSPSFVLMRRYDSGFLPLIHVDAYRLTSLGEFDDLAALEEGIDGVVVIEWGDAVIQALGDSYLRIEIEMTEDGRVLHLDPRGNWQLRPLSEVLP